MYQCDPKQKVKLTIVSMYSQTKSETDKWSSKYNQLLCLPQQNFAMKELKWSIQSKVK